MEAIRLREDAATIHTAMEWDMPNSPSKNGSRGTGKALTMDVTNVANVMASRAVPLLFIMITSIFIERLGDYLKYPEVKEIVCM